MNKRRNWYVRKVNVATVYRDVCDVELVVTKMLGGKNVYNLECLT